jgi:hypothetical protein
MVDKEFHKQVKFLLDMKVHEKRGLTSTEYTEICKKIWNECIINEEFQFKIIYDGFAHNKKRDNKGYNDFPELLDEELLGEDGLPILICTAISAGFIDDGIVKLASKFDPKKDPIIDDPIEPSPQDYLIGFFDVLGFENLISRIGLENLLEIYQNLIKDTIEMENYPSLIHLPVSNGLLPTATFLPIRYAYFSDTIFFWLPFNPHFCSAFTVRCADLICHSLKKDIPLRGSITVGKAVMNKPKNIYLGEPIVEAARLEENQNWIGASFGPSSLQYPFKMNPNVFLHPYSKHYKNSVSNLNTNIVVDWVRRWRELFRDDILILLNKLKNKSEDKLKYDNTIEFVSYSNKHKNWYKK